MYECSHADVRLLYDVGPVWPCAVQCPNCDLQKHRWHGRVCADCHRNQSHHAPAAAAPLPPSPASVVPAPLFDTHTTHDRVPTVQRAAVVVLDKQGRTRAEIGQQAGVSQPTVRRVLARYEETKDVSDARRSGRPRSTDEATDINIAVTARVEPFLMAPSIKRKLDLEDVSVSTVKRRLVEAGLPGRVSRHTFQLTDEHKHKRMSFAEGYKRWTDDDTS